MGRLRPQYLLVTQGPLQVRLHLYVAELEDSSPFRNEER